MKGRVILYVYNIYRNCGERYRLNDINVEQVCSIS